MGETCEIGRPLGTLPGLVRGGAAVSFLWKKRMENGRAHSAGSPALTLFCVFYDPSQVPQGS